VTTHAEPAAPVVTGPRHLPPVDVPTDRPGRGRIPPGSAATATRALPDALVAALDRAAAAGVPPAGAWHAALLAVLHRYTGRTDLTVGVGSAVVRTDLGGGAGFGAVAARASGDGTLRVALPRDGAELVVAAGPSAVTVTYPPALFDADRVQRFLDHLGTALGRGLAAPGTAVVDVDVLPPAERDLLLRAWNPAHPPRPPGLLHDVTAGHDPDHLAVDHPDAPLTYGALERRANHLARALRRHRITTGHVVGLLLGRGPHLPVAQLAVMKAGAAWLPLDPQHPPARLGYLLRDSGAVLVLHSADLAGLAADAAADLPCWDLDDPAVTGAHDPVDPGPPPGVDVRPDDPAYLLYTSGSTGTPKGVLVPHRCAHSYCRTAVEMYGTTPADRVVQASNPAFDASIFDLFATFLAGATLVSAPSETIVDPAAFADLIRTRRVTLSFVPAAVLAVLDPDEIAAGTLRAIWSAGEAMPPEQAVRWPRPGLELHNSYGPTETTVVVTDFACTPEPLDGPTPIGTAMAQHRVHVLDARLRPVPIGVPGQLHVSGAGVTYGYHRQPGLTAERFLADPFADRPGARMYATGDVVRWRADGILEFLGRPDRQVQIRGQRVELGEIEHVLSRHPDVRHCAVLLHDGTRLVAHVAGEPDVEDLRRHLADHLPSYMIPTTLHLMPVLPLTPNGKLDTARLPTAAPPPDVEHVAPRTAVERWLAETWRDLLGVERVGATDTFFDLGGTSLHAIRFAARVRGERHVDLPLRHLFAAPALEQVAARLAAAEPVVPDAVIVPRPHDGPLLCSRQQEGLWFRHQLDPESSAYHIGLELRLHGALDVAALARATHALVVRHEALRTRFVAVDGSPRQVVDPPPPAAAPLPVVDRPPADAARWVSAEVARPIDLRTGPLFRTPLARLAPDEHVLVVVLHHIVGDGWSTRVLARELSALYRAELPGGVPADLPPLRIQPADHAAWQRDELGTARQRARLDHRVDRLADLPTIALPTDRPRPAAPTGAGATLVRPLTGDLPRRARDFARTHQVSFLAVVQAALLTVLHRRTGQSDLAIGSVFSGRVRTDLEPLVGLFADLVVLRTDAGGDPGFGELVRRCHDTVLDATAHQDVPFAAVVDGLRPERRPGRHPLVQVSLSWQPPDAALGRLTLGAVTADPVDVATPWSRLDLTLTAIDAPDGRLDLSAEYSTELFDADRVDRLLDDLAAALSAGLSAPGTPISALDPPTPAGPALPAAGDGPGLDDEIAELEQRLAEQAEMVRVLAEKRAEKARRTAARSIVPVPRTGPVVCTHQQEGVWFDHQLDPASTVYHIVFALELRGDLDVDALGRALHALVARHESLRTRFVAEDGVPRQVVDPVPEPRPLPVTPLAAADVGAWLAGEVRRPTDLAVGPLFRAPLARVADDEHVLVLIVHHIVVDGWSVRILADELTRLYAAETGVRDARLPELRVQPADHAVWQRRTVDGGELDRQLAHWRATLADLPVVDLPTDRPRPADPTGAGASRERVLPADLAARTRAGVRAHGASLLAVAQAALLTVLHRYTGRTDLPIGSIFSGRTRADTESMVGYFVNPVVLRTRLDGAPTFAGLVARCHDTVLRASAHQDVPFGRVVDALRPERVPGRNPLFQVNLSLQPPGAALGALDLGGVVVRPLPVAGGATRFDIAIGVTDHPDGRLELSAEYATELFDADRVDRLLDHLTTALDRGLAAPDTPVADLDVLPPAERHRLLHGANDTAVARRAEPLHRTVEAVAAATPDATAVLDHDGTTLTYRQLDAAAERLAQRLRHHGVGAETAVGVCLPRGAHLVTALLATWKAGGIHVPLDPALPPDRLARLHADAAPAVVVTLAEHAPAFGSVIALDRPVPDTEPTAGPGEAPRPGAGPDSTAYLLYTSGSTGAPKGVAVPHRGLHNRIAWMQDVHGLDATDRVLHKTPYGFDVALWELCWPLVTGAALVIAAPGAHADPARLHRLIADTGVTTLHFVPTMLAAFLDHAAAHTAGPLGRVRRVFCSGETLPPAVAARFLAAWPDVELHNLYGPTEASIDVTAWRCEPDAATVPIGRPIANTRAYVLDAHLRPSPTGVPGQLFLAGTGLAHGYLGRPGTTAEAFLADPFTPGPGQRMYATGDLARMRADGVLEHLGRTDRQVKVHGQRVEPGEVEHVLASHPGVRHCAVVVRDGALAAYVVGTAEPAGLRRFLADRLPSWMVPAAVTTLPELPVTANGKLDTARLPAPAPAAERAHVEPRTPTERWLAATWAELLGVERVGAGDDFFARGGNSLHTTQLTARIHAHLGLTVHPRQVFAAPTLDGLAAHLDGAAASHRPGASGPLVPLRATGTLPPFFLVHPVGGAVTPYLELADLLGDDRPVHAIEDPQLHGTAPDPTLAARARRYADLVRTVAPHGPYRLGGWSLGGPVALEMARLLTEDGETVELVVALDSELPEPRPAPTELDVLTWFVLDVVAVAGVPLPPVDLDAAGGLGGRDLEDLALDVLARAGLAPSDSHEDLRTRMRVFAGNVRHHAGHRPRPFDGPLLLVTAQGNPETADAAARWRAVAPHLEHVAVPGDHYSVLRPPHVDAVAAAVRRRLGGGSR
jgi:amino acid adenylation domain-containing protein